jgi:uncharacterized phage protein (TIGR01671 family)
MREILLKGKRKDNGEWIEGSLITSINRAWISSEKTDSQRLRSISSTNAIWRSIEIIPDTICQFTGLTDKNGNKIWENDILMAHLDESYPEDVTYITVKWNFARFVAYEAGTDGEYLDEFDLEHFEVVGNIFDNPELLQEESDE